MHGTAGTVAQVYHHDGALNALSKKMFEVVRPRK